MERVSGSTRLLRKHYPPRIVQSGIGRILPHTRIVGKENETLKLKNRLFNTVNYIQ
jgi:hypothetical protein